MLPMTSLQKIPWSKVLTSIILFQVGGWSLAVCSSERLPKVENSEGTVFVPMFTYEEMKFRRWITFES